MVRTDLATPWTNLNLDYNLRAALSNGTSFNPPSTSVIPVFRIYYREAFMTTTSDRIANCRR
jgi:hypothetical protein